MLLLDPGSPIQQPAMVLLLAVVLVVRALGCVFLHRSLPPSLAVRALKKPHRYIFLRLAVRGQRCFRVRKPISGRLSGAFRTQERTPGVPKGVFSGRRPVTDR
ncbi:hypothetical protein NDU88_002965 [Pleurodeles waltl]|uniref:Secreted protein n=1 Tax=Pleurodeles waltl TaxID=8319 RepID=A0AAV7TPM1_PLEWA|nr:hypothetical protein NDU88_002965 [Pleurodeles waltl]